MPSVIDLDFETYSEVDLSVVGLWNYVNHPSTGVHCLSYEIDGKNPTTVFKSPWAQKDIRRRAIGQLEPLFRAMNAGAQLAAHNAQFEMAVWAHVLKWKPLPAERVICTMAAGYAMGLPGKLEQLAPALGIPIKKDATGHSLMLRLCKPTNLAAMKKGKDKKPIWALDQETFTFMGEAVTPAWALERLGEYCAQDVRVQAECRARMRPLSKNERKVWAMDQAVNTRGFQFDTELAHCAVALRDQLSANLDKRMAAVTGGDVQACTALPALKTWLEELCWPVESLSKDAIETLLTEPELPPDIQTALELRQDSGRATSVRKLDAGLALAGDDGRIRYAAQYHAANTGRFGGRGIQPHNFTRDLPKPDDVEYLAKLIKAGDLGAIDMLYDYPLTAISKALRGFIIAAKGNQLIGGDWSNVEGRGLAWVAGEEWKLDAFRRFDAGLGPDVYLVSYSDVFGTPVQLVSPDQRQIGKVMELSMGYQGGVGAFQSMAVNYGVRLPDEEADRVKHAWRNAHPATVRLWYATQEAAIKAVLEPGLVVACGAPGRQVCYKKAGSFLWARLPSGRLLCYPYPRVVDGKYGPMLTYKRVPSSEDRRRGRLVDDPTNTRSWARIGTYGGMLTENNIQALCRDILVECMLRLEQKGYPVVLHIHDEVAAEGRFTDKHRQEVERIMAQVPRWAKGFPLAAGCWLHHRYMKD